MSLDSAHSTENEPRPRKGRGTPVRFILAAFVLALPFLIVGAAEWWVRYQEATRPTVPDTMPQLYYDHSRQKRALVRDFDYYGWVRVNSLGFRGEETRVEKEEHIFRILALGGSTTFDRSVSGDERAWPARLEPMLNGRRDGRTYEVINAGTPGYRILDNMIRLQRELLPLRPDLIVLYHAHHDLFAAMMAQDPQWSPRPDEVNPPVALERWSYKHSLLVGKTLGRLRASQKGGDTSLIAPGRFEELLAEGTQSFRNDLTSLFAVTKAHGLDIIVPTVSYAWERADPATTHRWQRALPSIEPGDVPRLYSAYNEVIREVASQFDYPVVETREFGLELLDLYADGDPIHFNDEGADVMAHGLAAAISERLGYRGLSDFGLLTRSDHEPTPRSNSSTGSDHPQ